MEKVLSFEEFSGNRILETIHLSDIPMTQKTGNLDEIISRMCNAGYVFLGNMVMTNTRLKISRPEEIVNVVPEQIRNKTEIPTCITMMDTDDKSQIIEVLNQPYIEKVVRYKDDICVLWNPEELYFYTIKPDIYSRLFAQYFIEIRTKGVEQTLKDNGMTTEDGHTNESRTYTTYGNWTTPIRFDIVIKRILFDFFKNHEHIDVRRVNDYTESIYDLLTDWYDENCSDGYALDDEYVIISTKFKREEDLGSYDEEPWYDNTRTGEFKYNEESVKEYHNNISRFFDSDQDFSDLKSFFTYEEFKNTISEWAQEEFDENKGEFDK